MIIKTKIISVIALTIILTVGATTAVLLKLQNNKMIEDKMKDTESLCEIIESTTESAMKDGNAREVQKIIGNISKNKEIKALRILSPDGVILKSADTLEIGSKAADFPAAGFDKRIQKPTLISDTTINYFHGIDNRTECYGCHDKRSTLIGVIQIRHDISRNLVTFASIKRLLILSNVSVVILVSIILSLLFSRLVMLPLKSLLSAIREVEAGNWQAAVTVRSNDELGVIGTSFNKMIGEINKLYKKDIVKERELSRIRMELEHKRRLEELNSQLEFKVRELETANRAITSLSREVKNKNIALEKAVDRLKKINEVGRILSSIIETQELTRLIIQTAADLLNAEKVTLHLKPARRPEMTMLYRRSGGVEYLNNFSFELNQEYSDLFTYGRPLLISSSMNYNKDAGDARGSMIGVPLKMKGQIAGAMILENKVGGDSFTEDDLEVLTTISHHAMVAVENAWLYENVKANYFSTIQSLVNALEASDRFTRGHSERVRLLSVELGKHAGLDFKELELLEHASILHDIGKIGIDNFILQKQGKLTQKEFSLIKTHPLIGDEILGPIDTLDGVRKTIIQHHERYDGKGYPYGLRGDEISLKSKILSVVDTFDAMMSDRPYRKALTLFKVKEELRAHSGTQFDPYVVDAFIDLLTVHGENILTAAGYQLYTPV